MICDEINIWTSYWVVFVFHYFEHHISLCHFLSSDTYTVSLWHSIEQDGFSNRRSEPCGTWATDYQQSEPCRYLQTWKRVLIPVSIRLWTGTFTVMLWEERQESKPRRGHVSWRHWSWEKHSVKTLMLHTAKASWPRALSQRCHGPRNLSQVMLNTPQLLL